MFKGYCLNPVDGSWTPPVTLKDAGAAYRYCLVHHHWSPEIRICDADDYLVLHVEHHVLKCPLEDGTLRAIRLETYDN